MSIHDDVMRRLGQPNVPDLQDEIARLTRELEEAKAADQGWGEIDRLAREERDRVRRELEATREQLADATRDTARYKAESFRMSEKLLEAERELEAARREVGEYELSMGHAAISAKIDARLASAEAERDRLRGLLERAAEVVEQRLAWALNYCEDYEGICPPLRPLLAEIAQALGTK